MTGQSNTARNTPDRHRMQRRTALFLPPALAAGILLTPSPRAAAAPGRWPAERAHRWYRAQGWPVGANFITSNAVNQLEMFGPETFDPRRIEQELRAARLIGFNTVRVFLHDQLWAEDRAGFHRRLSYFVTLAARQRIKPLFVLFDSCWDPFPRPGRQRRPRPGVHNSGWVQSPGAERLGDPGYRRVMRDYVVSVLTRYRNDDRVLGWDLWNEPDNMAPQYHRVERRDKLDLVGALLPQVFAWARSVDPSQPLTSGVWQGEWADPLRRSPIAAIQLDHSDVITFHSYDGAAGFEGRIAELAPLGRPIMCTEYLARGMGSTVEAILPIAKHHHVGAYNWGLVSGRTQTIYPWDSWERHYPAAPQPWFHDLLHPVGRPYRRDEIQVIRQLTGRPRT